MLKLALKPLLILSLQLIVSTGLNFAWWGLAVIPTYFVVRQIGVSLHGADGLTKRDDTSGSEHDDYSGKAAENGK